MNQDTDRTKKIVTVSLLWGAMLFSYMIRLALGVAAPTLMKVYHIKPDVMGYVLSGWNWSYTAGLLFVGPLIDRLGAWIVMGTGALIWSISTIALPIAAGAASLFVLRLIFGLGHAPLIAANATAISRVFNVKERTRAIATSFSGNQVGLAAGTTIAASIMIWFGSRNQPNWKAVFYIIGGASLIWTLCWFLFFPDKYVGRQADRLSKQEQQRVPWLSLFQHRSTWGIAFGQLGYLYAQYFFVSWLPGYLVIERKMTILKSGLIGALPFWMGMLGTLGGGWLGDYLIRRGISTTASRKSIIGAGLTGATITVVAAAFVEQSWLAVTLLCLSVGSLRMSTGSANSLPIDLAPRSAVASLTSIQNFFGNIGGLLAPIVTGKIVAVTGSFVFALVAAGGMALFGAIAYVFIMGDVERNPIAPRAPAPAVHVSPSQAV